MVKEQEADPDIGQLKVSIQDKKPDRHTARAYSPSLKAYWQQWDSLIIKDNLVYRKVKCLKGKEERY